MHFPFSAMIFSLFAVAQDHSHLCSQMKRERNNSKLATWAKSGLDRDYVVCVTISEQTTKLVDVRLDLRL